MELTAAQQGALIKLIKCSNVKRLKTVLNLIILTTAARGDKAAIPIKAEVIEDFTFLYEFLGEIEVLV